MPEAPERRERADQAAELRREIESLRVEVATAQKLNDITARLEAAAE